MLVSNPKRPLDRAVEMSKVDYFCQKIAPYLIGLFIFILVVLAFIVLLKYGATWFGTESNTYYYHLGV